jgi:hypothetical protein
MNSAVVLRLGLAFGNRDRVRLAPAIVFWFRLAFGQGAGYGEGDCRQAEAKRQHHLLAEHKSISFFGGLLCVLAFNLGLPDCQASGLPSFIPASCCRVAFVR